MLLKLSRIDVLRMARNLWISEAGTGLRQYADMANDEKYSRSPQKSPRNVAATPKFGDSSEENSSAGQGSALLNLLSSG
jgi:hypothetical protein